jgi:hypothetical protein
MKAEKSVRDISVPNLAFKYMIILIKRFSYCKRISGFGDTPNEGIRSLLLTSEFVRTCAHRFNRLHKSSECYNNKKPVQEESHTG